MYLIVSAGHFVSPLHFSGVNLICHITFHDKILLKAGRFFYLSSKEAVELELKAKIRLAIKTAN